MEHQYSISIFPEYSYISSETKLASLAFLQGLDSSFFAMEVSAKNSFKIFQPEQSYSDRPGYYVLGQFQLRPTFSTFE